MIWLFKDVGAFPFLNSYLLVFAFWTVLLVLLLSCLALASSVKRPANASAAKVQTPYAMCSEAVAVLCAFSLVGLTIGLMAGNSRSPAVDAAISAVLTVYGGLTVYLFGSDQPRRTRVVGALSLIFLASTLELGIQTGATHRVKGESEERDLDDWHKNYLAQYQTQLDVYKASAIAAAKPASPTTTSASTAVNGH